MNNVHNSQKHTQTYIFIQIYSSSTMRIGVLLTYRHRIITSSSTRTLLQFPFIFDNFSKHDVRVCVCVCYSICCLYTTINYRLNVYMSKYSLSETLNTNYLKTTMEIMEVVKMVLNSVNERIATIHFLTHFLFLNSFLFSIYISLYIIQTLSKYRVKQSKNFALIVQIMNTMMKKKKK